MESTKTVIKSGAPTKADIRMKLVPKWVNAETFLELLQQDVENFEKIIDFKACPALNPGENYASVMVRITIEVELKDKSTKHLSYMMKLPHDHESMRQMLNIINMFHNERDALRDVLPELEQIYRDVGIDLKIGATAHLFPSDPNGNYVLMDDLGPLGWRNASRTECLDMKHVELVLRTLAQYHAASAVRVATKGPYPDVFTKSMENEQVMQIFAGMMMSFQHAFMKNLKSFKDGEKYEASFTNYFKSLIPNLSDTMNPNPNEFNVLSHGDCWSNNFLFKYGSDGEVEGITFVDFQMPRWCSPICDVLYFIFSSIRLDIKLTKFDYFIRYYHDNLIKNLKLLKYPKPLPLLRDMFAQTFKYGTFGVMTAIMVMPIVLFDSSEKSDFSNFVNGDQAGMEFKNMLYSNKRYHTYINDLLPWFYNRGILTDE